MTKQFFGKYRGTVAQNVDPLSKGRVQVSVPAVLGDGRLSWAMPCVPYAANGKGYFAIPPVDAKVWVEFENGDPNKPIWVGCFWGDNEAPEVGPTAFLKKVFKTDTATITLDDTPGLGGITIELSNGSKIEMNAQGIEITNGSKSIKLDAISVKVNDGSLDVT